jgi:hypothetical protein
MLALMVGHQEGSSEIRGILLEDDYEGAGKKVVK